MGATGDWAAGFGVSDAYEAVRYCVFFGFFFCFVYAVTVFVCVCGYFGVLCMHVSDAYEAVRHFLCLLLFFCIWGNCVLLLMWCMCFRRL